jgi:hypothetical protein
MQLLLFPDPRPLVERLGREFFRQAPQGPGVYLMRGATEEVLYVGKARNLRRRLGCYRVANPERLPRRHLRLLRLVVRIELQTCPTESAALARESELIRSLRPRFNRAGTWPGPLRFLAWRLTDAGLELAVLPELRAGWSSHGPMGAGAFHLRASLLRLLWAVIHPERGLAQLPAGWSFGSPEECITLPRLSADPAALGTAAQQLSAFFDGQAGALAEWIQQHTSSLTHPFELALRESDLEALAQFAQRRK